MVPVNIHSHWARYPRQGAGQHQEFSYSAHPAGLPYITFADASATLSGTPGCPPYAECSSVHLPHWYRGPGRQSQGCQSLLNPQHPTKGRERQGSGGRQPVFPRKQLMGSACPVHHIPIHHTLPRLTAPSDARSLSPEHPGRHSALEGDPTPPSVSG